VYSDSTKHIVPHPKILLVDRESQLGRGERIHFLACKACSQEWAQQGKEDGSGKVTQWNFEPKRAEYCFHGEHTLQKFPKEDLRVRKPKSLDLEVGPELQSRVNC